MANQSKSFKKSIYAFTMQPDTVTHPRLHWRGTDNKASCIQFQEFYPNAYKHIRLEFCNNGKYHVTSRVLVLLSFYYFLKLKNKCF